MAEVLKITAIPKATAEVWTISPVQRPNITANPAPLPRRAACVRTKMLSGPGAKARRSEARKNVADVSKGNMGM
jgi:hypothetical protein